MTQIWKIRNSNTSLNFGLKAGQEAVQEGVQRPLPAFNEELERPLPALIAKLLQARGFADSTQVQSWLYPKVSELKDPFLMLGMKLAVVRLTEAFLKNEKICIYADFDLDGTSGLALMYEALKGLGFNNVQYYQPKRLSEGYGFHASAVEDLASQGVSLIVTVDVGITALEACQKAKQIGIDVIITDHHLPAEALPEALVVVNPNQQQDKSGLGYLCGAGVAFYLLRALKRELVENGIDEAKKFDLKNILDFFTIATLTDMVPLIEDNRVLVKMGLQSLQKTSHPGLSELLKELGLAGRPLNAQDVAIRFAPKLNALSRMEMGIFPRDLMLVQDQVEAKRLVTEVIKNNKTRVQLQADAEAMADRMMADWPEKDFLFLVSDQFHRGVVGLIATRLSQSYNRPAFVGAKTSEGVIVGSARIPNGAEICLVEALASASEFLTRSGGHSAAAGFELHVNQQSEVISRIKSHFENLKISPKPMEIIYDLDANLEDIDKTLMSWYEFVGPFGVGFQAPLFRFLNISLDSLREMKGGHYRLSISNQEGLRMEALLFSPSERQVLALKSKPRDLDILGEIQWNYFAGQKSVQLLVREFKVNDSGEATKSVSDSSSKESKIL